MTKKKQKVLDSGQAMPKTTTKKQLEKALILSI